VAGGCFLSVEEFARPFTKQFVAPLAIVARSGFSVEVMISGSVSGGTQPSRINASR
jgi:hypothetical protein